jgi:hypothetical protein
MSIIFHLLSKDLRRMAPTAVVYAALVAVQPAAAIWYMHGGVETPGNYAFFRAVSVAGVLLDLIIGLMFACSLIQEDPPRDPGSFWVTRPVSGLVLFAEKLIAGLLLVVLLPLLVYLPWWVGEGLTIGFIMQAGLIVAGVHAFLLFLAFVAALFIKRHSSLLIVLVCTVLVLFSGIFLLGSYYGNRTPIPPLLDEGRVLVSRLVALAALIAVCIHFFVTRRFLRSLCGLGAGLLCFLLILGFWPWRSTLWSLEWESARFDRIRIGDAFFRDPARPGEVMATISGLRENEVLRLSFLEGALTREGRNNPVDANEALLVDALPERSDVVRAVEMAPTRSCATQLLSLRPRKVVDAFSVRRTQAEAELISAPEFKGRLVANLWSYRRTHLLPFEQGVFSVSEFGLCQIDRISLLEKGRIEVQVTELTQVTKSGSDACYAFDPASGNVYQLSRIQPDDFSLKLGVSRCVYRFELGHSGVPSFATRREALNWLGSLQLALVSRCYEGRLLREIFIPAAQVELRPLDKAKWERLQQVLQGSKHVSPTPK